MYKYDRFGVFGLCLSLYTQYFNINVYTNVIYVYIDLGWYGGKSRLYSGALCDATRSCELRCAHNENETDMFVLRQCAGCIKGGPPSRRSCVDEKEVSLPRYSGVINWP